ncbi:cleavage stimulation factor subunit 2 isoform X1 [Lepisosteus oculatus]|uniref:cleavage stimulation factor subunit 2 isoform X1 n=1 Tax=Lepisosteus oculatus TaxID=7918 RepID=UPI00073FC727|nr:PREDICTED: cleavage stimulation factor subunit 2 isoform X1 [Lepisosteus oculatus]
MASTVVAAAAAAGRDPAVDRSLRSVFVGNIPYEATEEQLKDIFSEVGLVVSFRLVYDRETGKPKGYGFCEYQDQETALSAMRNLNGREFSGRALRVDNAASEKNKEELKSLGTGAPVIESPYGDPCQPEEAPESISRAVASLPPEQMFELMKQMKLCVQNSPQEARNMLLQNPQLAYALLQAQVVMRIVDPEIALKMLHRQAALQPLIPSSQAAQGPLSNQALVQSSVPVSQPQPMAGMHVNGAPQMMSAPQMVSGVAGQVPGQGPVVPAVGMQPQIGIPPGGPVPMDRGQGNLQHSPVGSSGQAALERPQVPMTDPRAPMRGGVPPVSAVVAPRGLLGDGPNDPRGGTLLSVTGEVVEPSRGFMGAPSHQGPPMHMTHDGRGPPPDMRGPHDMRGGPMGEPRGMMGDPRGPMMDQRAPPMEARAPIAGGRDPRAVEARSLEARGPVPAQRVPMATGIQGPVPHTMGANVPQPQRQQAPGVPGVPQTGGFSPAQNQVTSQDHEKAALIMQVLQLTPEQIAMLPPEQRQSILILKEQIQKTAGAP